MRRKGKRRPAMKPPCSTPEQTRIFLVSRLMCKVLAGDTISQTTFMPTYIVEVIMKTKMMRRATSTMARVRQMRREAAGEVQGGAPRSLANRFLFVIMIIIINMILIWL